MIRINDKGEKVTVKNMLLATVTTGFCLILSVFAPATASADWSSKMSTNGGPYSGSGYSKIELFITTSGNTWSGDGTSNFSKTSWSSDKVNSTYVVANSSTRTKGTLSWDALFTGTQTTNYTVDVLVYKKSTDTGSKVYGVRYSTTDGGKTYTYTQLDWRTFSSYNRTASAVPVPPTVFLLGAGLIGVAVLRKRVNRQDNAP